MRLTLLICLTMVAFSGNSILNRLALEDGAMGPSAFAAVRLMSGAFVLVLMVVMQGKVLPWQSTRRWLGASSLALYVLGFSFAYVALPTGTGALIMFAGVQSTMFAGAVLSGAKVPLARYAGAGLAFVGLGYLLWPVGAGAPPLWGAVLMLVAGFGSGMYSLVGAKASDPFAETAVNFAWASPIAIFAFMVWPDQFSTYGIVLACVSGAITSGLAYAVWYSVLPRIEISVAALAQLTVPLIALLGGMLLLDEALTPRFAVACVLVLGGVALGLSTRAARVEGPAR